MVAADVASVKRTLRGLGETASVAPTPAVIRTTTHPSAPIPVQGPPPGAAVRTPLGGTGLAIFPLILGGAEFGWNIDGAAADAVLDAFVACGGNALHTSDSFAGGRSEHIIGDWLHRRGARDDIVVAARVGTHPDNPGLGPVNLVRATEASLQRLQTDHIDILYLDASAGDAAVEDVLATAEWLVDSGKTRAVAARGFTAEQLVEARVLCSAGYPRLQALDVPLNVLRRDDYDDDLRLVAGAQGLAVTPSHALAHGYLSGRHRTRGELRGSVRGAQMAGSANRRGARVLRALDRVAAAEQVPTAAVAVAWLLAQPTVTAPIVNAFSPGQVEQLAQGVGMRLTRAYLSEIARAAA